MHADEIPPNAAIALRHMASLQQVSMDAVLSSSRRELIFTVLNRTASVASFERAYLWDMRGKPALLGVSGTAVPAPKTAEAKRMRGLVSGLAKPDEARVLPPSGMDGESPLWLPLSVHGAARYALLLLRQSDPAWTDAEVTALKPLATVFGGVFRLFDNEVPGGRRRFCPGAVFRAGAAAAALLGLAALLVFVRLPLRIVAPCEVIAASPVPVNAPLDGVIRSISVRPGDPVREGDELYVYNDDVEREELAVGLKQVELAKSNLERVMSQAVADRAARADARMLQNRLAQENIRLQAVRERVAKLVVTAPLAGTVIMGDPAAIVGKPIRVGEEVLLLADQDDNRLRIWLPQDDRIDFDFDQVFKVFLHADAGSSRRASLVYVAAHAQLGSEGVYGFMAEAVWADTGKGIRLGLKGTAVLYGKDVSLGYWLVRKPLAMARRFFGV